MTRLLVALCALLPVAAGCANGGSNVTPVSRETAADPAASAQSVASSPLRRSLTSGANDLLYVGNTGNNSISVYWHAASGNTAPLYTIAGSKTGISAPGQLSADGQGNLYVANGSYEHKSAKPAILVFAHGARGNVAPIRTIAGPETGIHAVTAMKVNPLTGDIFVADDVLRNTYDDITLLRFAPGANGNATPLARSASNINKTFQFMPLQFALDSTGRHLIAQTMPNQFVDNFCRGLAEYPTQFTDSTLIPTTNDVGGFCGGGIADDPTTHTFLISDSSGIYRLAENTVGYGPDNGTQPSFKPAAVSIVTSDGCGGQMTVAPGPMPYTYVVQSQCGTAAVNVYANNASGKATPLRVLSGPATAFNVPYGIYEGP